MKFAFLPLSKLIPQSKCHAVSWSVRRVYPVNATQGMQCHAVSCSVMQCQAMSCSVMQCSQCVPCWQSLWILWSAILKTTKPWWSKLNPTKCQASWNNTDFVLNPYFWIFRNQMFGTTGNHISTYSKVDGGNKYLPAGHLKKYLPPARCVESISRDLHQPALTHPSLAELPCVNP